MTETETPAAPETTDAAAAAAEPRRRVWIARVLSGVVRRTRRTREGYREVQKVLFTLRAPIYVTLLGVVVFAGPDQILEIYRLFAEDFRFDAAFGYETLRFASFFAMLYLACYAIWYIARVLTLIDRTTHGSLHHAGADGLAARWGPRILGAAPAFAAALGMLRAEAGRPANDESDQLLFAAAAIAFLIGVWRLYSTWRRTHTVPGLYDNLKRGWFNPYVRAALAIGILGGIGFLMTQPIAFTQAVGALSIICFFMIALLFGWAQLTALYDRFAIPAIGILALAVIVFAAFDLNDNHFFRELKPERQAAAGAPTAQRAADGVGSDAEADKTEPAMAGFGPPPTVTIRTAFDDWYAARADRAAYEEAGAAYPVYIVAAQGGGLYAAYQSAVFMALLQDACPTFAQHVFAISGVSGGSVGGAVFTAIAAEHAENLPIESVDAPCGASPKRALDSAFEKTDAMLRQDFLSPLIAATLFGDFTARFSPYPIDVFDRARALERAFELSWNADLPAGAEPPARTPLELGLLSYWRPDGAAPLVFFNTTETETGRRMILTPIPDLGDLTSFASAVAVRADGETPDMRLSTAAVLSARFPYITPAGSIPLKIEVAAVDGAFSKVRLVDGGYFENSGVDTAMEIIRAISAGAPGRDGPPIDLRLIVFDLTKDRFRDANYGFGEALTPVKALLAARESRSGLTQTRARRELGAPCRYVYLGGARPPGAVAAGGPDSFERLCRPSDMAASKVWSVSLNDYEYDFALGWILSRATLDRIRGQLGDPDDCVAPSAPRVDFAPSEAAQDDAVARHNGCIARIILDQLALVAPPRRAAQTEPPRQTGD